MLGYSTNLDTDFATFKAMQRELKLLRKAVFRAAEYLEIVQAADEQAVSREQRRRGYLRFATAMSDYLDYCEEVGLDHYP